MSRRIASRSLAVIATRYLCFVVSCGFCYSVQTFVLRRVAILCFASSPFRCVASHCFGCVTYFICQKCYNKLTHSKPFGSARRWEFPLLSTLHHLSLRSPEVTFSHLKLFKESNREESLQSLAFHRARLVNEDYSAFMKLAC